MKRIFISAIIAASLFAVSGCKDKAENKVLTREVTFKKEGELLLKKAGNDSIIANLDIEIVDDDYQIQTGLMYRKSMEPNRGMLFIFKYQKPLSFYMKNTEFSLDIIYINNAKKIVSITKNTTPFDQTSLPSGAPARYVLEVNAGLTDDWNLAIGDIVEWRKLAE
jgi:uncharacterized membrane protein (UPF0127 family)